VSNALKDARRESDFATGGGVSEEEDALDDPLDDAGTSGNATRAIGWDATFPRVGKSDSVTCAFCRVASSPFLFSYAIWL